MKCYIYRNLHKPGHTYSLRAMEGEHAGRVIGYSSCFAVEDVKFVVNEAGRQKVLATGHKNVHAAIVGSVTSLYGYEARRSTQIELHETYYNMQSQMTNVSYNPHKAATFYNVNTGEPVYGAGVVFVSGNRIEAYSVTASEEARPYQGRLA